MAPGQPILCKAIAMNKNIGQYVTVTQIGGDLKKFVETLEVKKGCSKYMEDLKKLLDSTGKRVVANFLGWR